MGTWGYKNFENDDALDWSNQLVKEAKKDYVIRALWNIDKSDYIEAPEAVEALCTAEIILAYFNQQFGELPDEVQIWLKKKHGLLRKQITFVESDRILAKALCKKVINNSELAELWQESDEYESWLGYVQSIYDKL